MDISENEEIVMKLLHYFITNYNYNPVVLHGAKNEIWLENLDENYKIIRLVSNYIHNDEQLQFDLYRTNQIMKSIKKKTLSMHVPVLSIFVNLGDNVHLEETEENNISCVKAQRLQDVVKNSILLASFPDIEKTLSFKEEGLSLFTKLTQDINEKTKEDAQKAENVFAPKKPIVTYILIAINILVFILMYVLGNGSENVETLIQFGANNRGLVIGLGEYYRLFTCSFLHIGILHLVFNMYALYLIGSQVENFFGKAKYLLIYFGSAITASLLSICFSNSISAGASGAIFGLLGALLYFGYHYRLYLGNTIKTQIVPVIVLNLALGFILTGVDNAAHIGGCIGGLLLAMACGVKYKSKTSDRINGIILSVIYIGFMIFLLFR